MDKRSKIYRKYQEYFQRRDRRSMDTICTSNNEFRLQIQQEFLKKYVTDNPNWKSLLLYHQIGSGKTCTSITIAEQYMSANPGNKVTVILPARLRTNFFDELVSPCGMNKYISKEDFDRYQSSEISESSKKRIRTKFLASIAAQYGIMSFEQFRITAQKRRLELAQWARDFTKDKLIIIDEVHNLLSSSYDLKGYEKVAASGELPKGIKGVNTVITKYLMTHAHPTCKFVYLTATPVFDNLGQFKELTMLLSPNSHIPRSAKVADVINLLKGKVSYFPGVSQNAYPSMKYHHHEIKMSETQNDVIEVIQAESNDEHDPEKEAFMSKERQASLACLPGRARVDMHIDQVLSKLGEYAPKLKALMKEINSRQNYGKHLVYSSFIKAGLKIVEAMLRKNGWVSLRDVKDNEAAWARKHYKVYALWDGSVKDYDKQLIKGVVNSKDNVDGKLVRVILGSPSIREGVSFKHVQHMHLLDPVWNSSAKAQVEGRAVRFCSHVDIPVGHPKLKREVMVHIYKLIPRPNGTVFETSDQIIYDKIIPKKEMMITAAERSLKKVSLDFHLFRNMHQDDEVTEEMMDNTINTSNVASVISVSDEDNLKLRNKGARKVKNTCPKPRRPDEDGNCKPGSIKKQNNHGHDCCYVARFAARHEGQ